MGTCTMISEGVRSAICYYVIYGHQSFQNSEVVLTSTSGSSGSKGPDLLDELTKEYNFEGNLASGKQTKDTGPTRYKYGSTLSAS